MLNSMYSFGEVTSDIKVLCTYLQFLTFIVIPIFLASLKIVKGVEISYKNILKLTSCFTAILILYYASICFSPVILPLFSSFASKIIEVFCYIIFYLLTFSAIRFSCALKKYRLIFLLAVAPSIISNATSLLINFNIRRINQDECALLSKSGFIVTRSKSMACRNSIKMGFDVEQFLLNNTKCKDQWWDSRDLECVKIGFSDNDIISEFEKCNPKKFLDIQGQDYEILYHKCIQENIPLPLLNRIQVCEGYRHQWHGCGLLFD